MDYSRFWRLGCNTHDAAYLEPVTPKKIDDSGFLITTGQVPPPSNFVQKVFAGRTAYSLIRCASVHLKVWSAAMLAALEQAQITGWKSYPMEIRDLPRNCKDTYRGVCITGRCGPRIPSLSAVATELALPPIVRTGLIEVGTFWDPGSWDGSDVFSPEGTSTVFMTERAKIALEEASLRGLEFTRADLIEHQILT